MRKSLLLAALFLAPLSALATTTVTGHISDLSGTAQTGGTFARFNLRGCSGNQPRVNGVTLIAPTQGGVYYKDFVANASGNISGTLYSNRDSTGLLAGEIQCGTSYTGTWYGLTIYQAGKAGPETPIYAKNGATLDVTTVVPITTNPVVTAPTGDSTYLRLDTGNSPARGSLTVTNTGLGGIAPIYALASGVTVNEAAIVASCQQLANAFCEGGQFTASDSGAGPIGSVIGIAAVPSHLAAGTLGTITGLDVAAIVGGGAGAITTSRGVHVGGVSFPTGTSPTTHDGIIIDDQCAGSFPATNCTGIRVAAQSNGKPGVSAGNINGILYVATGQYASLQAAHDALPAGGGTVFVTATGTPFGAAGTTALAITKPIHVIFDAGSFTYSGAGAQAISCSVIRGIILEGSGRRGDDTGTSGTSLNVSNTAANGINAAACNGITVRDLNLIGPASGTGKGVINSSGRATYSNLNISSFGSDGWTNDGSSNNANSVLVSKVRSSSNGGNGFVTKGANGQLVTFIEADGSINTGDGWNVANQLNVFQGTNADGNTGYDYHFVSGGTGNTGNIFSNNAGAGPPGGIQFDAGANSNTFTQLGSGGTLLVTSGLGTNNSVWSQAQTTYTSGDNNMTLGLSSGVGAGVRGSSINFLDNNTNKWTVQKTATNTFAIVDPGVLNMMILNAGSAVQLASGGSQDVRVNDQASANTGTGGFSVWSGGASSTKRAQITGGGLLVDVNAVTPCTNGELVLSANWGNTGAPTVTLVAGTGQTCQWTITAGGAATGASPTITDTLTNALPTATTVCDMRMVGGTGAATLINQTGLSATAPVFTFGGTPGVGLTYIVVRRCGP